jgi:hypothetical protein
VVVGRPRCESPATFDPDASGCTSEDGASDSSQSSDDHMSGGELYSLCQRLLPSVDPLPADGCVWCKQALVGEELSNVKVLPHGGVMRCQGSLDRRVAAAAKGKGKGFAVIRLLAEPPLSMVSANVAVLAAMRDVGCCAACVNKGCSLLARPWRMKPGDRPPSELDALVSHPDGGLSGACIAPHLVVPDAAADALCRNLAALHRSSLWCASHTVLESHARTGTLARDWPVGECAPTLPACKRLFA